MLKIVVGCVVLLLATAASQAQAAGEPEAVMFPSNDGTLLKAWLFRPEERAPTGTVVALHGCGGLYASRGPRKGALNPRHQAMAELLVEEGYAVLFPDSLTPRGVDELCTQKFAHRSINQTQRRVDALASLAWVAAQPWADASRVALLGWSHGGSAVLSATDATRPEVAAQPLRFAAAIAFYPGCGAATKSGYLPNAPLSLLLGALDDWTPPEPCVVLGKSVGAEVRMYEGAYHDFDNPVGAVRLRLDVPNGMRPGEGVHAGPNPAARQSAYAYVRATLAKAFSTPLPAGPAR